MNVHFKTGLDFILHRLTTYVKPVHNECVRKKLSLTFRFLRMPESNSYIDVNLYSAVFHKVLHNAVKNSQNIKSILVDFNFIQTN